MSIIKYLKTIFFLTFQVPQNNSETKQRAQRTGSGSCAVERHLGQLERRNGRHRAGRNRQASADQERDNGGRHVTGHCGDHRRYIQAVAVLDGQAEVCHGHDQRRVHI